jgi:predicted membrane protein
MSEGLLTALIVGPATLVVIGFFLVLWNARRTPVQTLTAVISGIVLLVWAVGAALLAQRGFFRPPDATSAPPIGKFILAALVGMTLCLALSRSLRRLFSNQRHLIWLNVWRLVGAVFLLLMSAGRMPVLWALPAGIGDIIVGMAAPWVAMNLDKSGGERRAVIFNLFGLVDLVVAVGLGIATSPGPLQLFRTLPTSELATRFPLSLVPTFLVPLAFMLHIVSLWQLWRGTWSSTSAASNAA